MARTKHGLTGIYNSVAITLDDQEGAALAIDSSGRLILGTGTASLGVVDTELPVAAALADASANPTTPLIGANLMVFGGATWNRLRGANVFKPQNAVTANPAGGVTGWTPAFGKKFRVLGYHLISSVAENIILYDGTVAGAVIVTVIPSGAGGSGIFVSLGNGYLSDTADKVLTIKTTTTTGGTVSGVVFGTEE